MPGITLDRNQTKERIRTAATRLAPAQSINIAVRIILCPCTVCAVKPTHEGAASRPASQRLRADRAGDRLLAGGRGASLSSIRRSVAADLSLLIS